MDEIKLSSWNEFEAMFLTPSIVEVDASRPLLFRGQRNPEWKLETTLERHGIQNIAEWNYHRSICSAACVIESVTGKKWDLTPVTLCAPPSDVFKPPPDYPFLAFLRQNGFPSPLLDWTRSPYVAAYFAFHDAQPDKHDFVAVFECRDYDSMYGFESDPIICAPGPWIATDKKHLLQQSEYTVCRRRMDPTLPGVEGKHVVYWSHEDAITKGGSGVKFRKLLIPSNEKDAALWALRRMNITAYSLFETTESLMHFIARELLVPDQRRNAALTKRFLDSGADTLKYLDKSDGDKN